MKIHKIKGSILTIVMGLTVNFAQANDYYERGFGYQNEGLTVIPQTQSRDDSQPYFLLGNTSETPPKRQTPRLSYFSDQSLEVSFALASINQHHQTVSEFFDYQ